MGVVALKKAERRHRIQPFLAAVLEHVPDLEQDVRALAEASHVNMNRRSLTSECTESVDM